MEQLLSIHFKSGRRRWIDLGSYVSSEPFGPNLATELDLRLDDISEGLYLEISYNAMRAEDKPEWGQAPQEADERGAACELVGGAYYCILEPNELSDVSRIEAGGEVLLKAFGDHVVVLEKLNTLCQDYLGDPSATYLAIAMLYPILRDRRARTLGTGEGAAGEDVDRDIAMEMGITVDVLNDARAFVEQVGTGGADSEEGLGEGGPVEDGGKALSEGGVEALPWACEEEDAEEG